MVGLGGVCCSEVFEDEAGEVRADVDEWRLRDEPPNTAHFQWQSNAAWQTDSYWVSIGLLLWLSLCLLLFLLVVVLCDVKYLLRFRLSTFGIWSSTNDIPFDFFIIGAGCVKLNVKQLPLDSFICRIIKKVPVFVFRVGAQLVVVFVSMLDFEERVTQELVCRFRVILWITTI